MLASACLEDEKGAGEEVEKAKAEIAEEVRHIFLKLVHELVLYKRHALILILTKFMLTIAIYLLNIGYFYRH